MFLPNRATLALIGLFLTTQASATAYEDHGMQVVAKLPMDQFKSDLVFHNAPCRIGGGYRFMMVHRQQMEALQGCWFYEPTKNVLIANFETGQTKQWSASDAKPSAGVSLTKFVKRTGQQALENSGFSQADFERFMLSYVKYLKNFEKANKKATRDDVLEIFGTPQKRATEDLFYYPLNTVVTFEKSNGVYVLDEIKVWGIEDCATFSQPDVGNNCVPKKWMDDFKAKLQAQATK